MQPHGDDIALVVEVLVSVRHLHPGLLQPVENAPILPSRREGQILRIQADL
jgi:hypothetical protein